MAPLSRAARVVLLAVCGLFLVALTLGTGVEPVLRVIGIIGVATTVAGLRIVLGPVVVVGDEGLRITRSWPLRREIPWYRILDVEVVPVSWVLEIELNNGEHIELPAVEHLNELYERIEALRHELDA